MPSRLEKRLELSAQTFLAGNPALAPMVPPQLLAEVTAAFAALQAAFPSASVLVRDQDAPLTPSGQLPAILLVIVGRDIGRIGLTPMRNVELSFTVRSNVKAASGLSNPFDAACAALEDVLDGVNWLKALTDDVTLLVHLFVCVRQPGCTVTRTGMIREQTYTMAVKCVGTEHTSS